MRKKKILHNFTTWCLFATNSVYAARYGFSWMYCATAVLMLLILILDIWEVIHNGRR